MYKVQLEEKMDKERHNLKENSKGKLNQRSTYIM